MKREEFSFWLSGVERLSVDQRREALAALADVGGGEGLEAKAASETLANGARAKPRSVVARTLWERAAMSGWRAVAVPVARGREVIAWGRSRGLSRFRRKSCGRTFNALTQNANGATAQKGALARSRPGDD